MYPIKVFVVFSSADIQERYITEQESAKHLTREGETLTPEM